MDTIEKIPPEPRELEEEKRWQQCLRDAEKRLNEKGFDNPSRAFMLESISKGLSTDVAWDISEGKAEEAIGEEFHASFFPVETGIWSLTHKENEMGTPLEQFRAAGSCLAFYTRVQTALVAGFTNTPKGKESERLQKLAFPEETPKKRKEAFSTFRRLRLEFVQTSRMDNLTIDLALRKTYVAIRRFQRDLPSLRQKRNPIPSDVFDFIKAYTKDKPKLRKELADIDHAIRNENSTTR